MTNHHSEILVERQDGWAAVLLNRPQRRNATTTPVMQALEALSADASVAAIVLRGAQGAFCSGIDLTELQ
jgi:2-(1,2-epoxy-1,2-dihydrophenyl)acetyl-CoA isomerase